MRDLVDQMGGGRGRDPEPLNDDNSQKVKLHDFAVALHYDTGKAVFVSETGEEAKAVWLPKSKIEILDGGKKCTGTDKRGREIVVPHIEVTVPEWLAKEKGLI